MSDLPQSRLGVVLVDVDEHPVAPATVDAVLEAARRSGADVIVVDARTTPGRAWIGLDVRVERASADLGGTVLRAKGLAALEAPIVAFLDARAVPNESWLVDAERLLLEDEGIASVSGAIPDIGEPTLNFTGNIGPRHPLRRRGRHDVLFPSPEAAVFRRVDLERFGDFAPEWSWPCLVAFLGWALTLAGRRVVLDPTPNVVGRCTCDAHGFSGLGIVYCCMGDDALEAALLAAVAVAARRDAVRGVSTDASTIDRFVDSLPSLADRREKVQAQRIRTDAEVLPLFIAGLEAGPGDEALSAEFGSFADRYQLRAFFPTRSRILVVTPDILTTRLAGPAIRAWEISEALADRHLVILASTATTCEVSSPRFRVVAPGDILLRRVAEDVDVVVVQGFAMEGRPYLRAEDKVVIVDLYDPLHLEQLELFREDSEEKRRVTVREATRVLNEQLVRGDFFVCASRKQRDFWLGQLSGLGRVNFRTYDDGTSLQRLLSVVPFGLPEVPPAATGPAMKGVIPGIGTDDQIILWGGGIYNWFDPLTLIRAVDVLKEDVPNVRLFFMGLRHPNPEVSEMSVALEARRLSRQLSLTDRFVFFNEGWVPYESRQNFLLEASIGVSTHLDHVETEFSFRTRILDYIWGTVPIVATKGDWFADLIELEGVGLTVPPRDVDALAGALRRLLSDTAFSQECRVNLERLRPRFHWADVLEPITSFCCAPRRASDLSDLQTRATLWASDADRLADYQRSQPSALERLRSIVGLR